MRQALSLPENQVDGKTDSAKATQWLLEQRMSTQVHALSTERLVEAGSSAIAALTLLAISIAQRFRKISARTLGRLKHLRIFCIFWVFAMAWHYLTQRYQTSRYAEFHLTTGSDKLPLSFDRWLRRRIRKTKFEAKIAEMLATREQNSSSAKQVPLTDLPVMPSLPTLLNPTATAGTEYALPLDGTKHMPLGTILMRSRWYEMGIKVDVGDGEGEKVHHLWLMKTQNTFKIKVRHPHAKVQLRHLLKTALQDYVQVCQSPV